MATEREVEFAKLGTQLMGVTNAQAVLLREVIRNLGIVLQSVDGYLSVGLHNQVGSGSFYHQEIKAAAQLAKTVVEIK